MNNIYVHRNVNDVYQILDYCKAVVLIVMGMLYTILVMCLAVCSLLNFSVCD